MSLQALDGVVDQICQATARALKQRNKIIFCGNGGSAADSQHLAAELVGRYQRNRPALPAIALTVDTSALTAIANDFGYDHVFARQLQGLGQAGDLLFALSTSGNSKNVINAIITAKEMGIGTIGMTGAGGGDMKDLCDILLAAPSNATNHIQEMHIAIGHFVCGFLENTLNDSA